MFRNVMRLKHVWNYVPIPSKLKLFADRITFSKITTFYFVFSVLNCIIQVVFEAQAFKINESAANFLNSIIVQGNVTQRGFAVLEKNDLRWCTSVPNNIDASSCQVIWNGTDASESNNQAHNAVSVPASSSSTPASSSTISSSVTGSSSVTRATSTPLTSSVSQTSTLTVTISDISELQSALQVAEAAFHTSTATTAATATVTKTVQAVPSDVIASIAAGNTGDTHTHKKRITIPHIISAINVDGQNEVKIGGLYGKDEVSLSQSCLVSLTWPLGSVDNTKREDIVFIGFSFWVLGMSLVAILNESPPHIVAAFLTHALAAAWSVFQILNTNQFHNDFTRLTTRGACGVNLLPTYWNERARFEIPTLVMNVLTLFISAFLSWKLMKSFGWQTFKRIGASLEMSRAYRIILIFSIVIQLSVFFIVVSVALWVDQVYNGDIAHLTIRASAFKAVTILILVLMIPWLSMGWISVRREQKVLLLVFLALSLLYLVGWSCMFLAPTFKWTFVEWRFFSLMATASAVLALAALVLGIVCLRNFNKGMTRYLNAQQPLPGDDFEPATHSHGVGEKESWGDEEKIEFPSYETSLPMPTFADVPPPPPAYMSSAPRTLGPRFYGGANAGAGAAFDRPAISIDTSVGVDPVRVDLQPPGLSRMGSGSSTHSLGSSADHGSSPMGMRGKRWIIE